MKKFTVTPPLAAFLLMICALLSGSYAKAYTWVAPTHTQTTFGNIGSNAVLNSANITYATNTGTGQLGVICWDKGMIGGYSAGPGFVVFDDQGNSVKTTYATAISKLDVIIGNSVNGTTPNYRVAVVYTNAGHDIKVDLYRVDNAGSSSLAVTYLSTTTIATKGYDDPHIDIIMEEGVTTTLGVTTPLGLYNCSKYVVTFSDNTGGNIYGYYDDINGTVTSSLAIIGSPPSTRSYVTPDVAAIQLSVSGVTHDYARFTWANDLGDIYYGEWDITAGTTSSSTVATAGTRTYNYPRIDAIDDYTTNSSTTQANYLLVFNAVDPATTPAIDEIACVDNLSTYFCTNPYLNTDDNYDACVAAGPGSKYMVGYYTTHVNPAGYGGHVATQTVDYSSGTLTNLNFYQVDNYSGSYTSVAGPDPRKLLAVSASCNDGAYALVAWCYNLVDLTYKYTGSSIAFKKNPNSIPNTNNEISVSASPNPAVDYLQVTGIQGVGGTYSVLDLTERIVLTGNLQANTQRIDISHLANSTYFMKVQTSTQSSSIQFVKQ
ncbi:MAG: T9SS type A sorting domain-containing protein [Taibaiella sp.]|nr:T9SS type A sorting domain-containing protein [Taibaiella sp.]